MKCKKRTKRKKRIQTKFKANAYVRNKSKTSHLHEETYLTLFKDGTFRAQIFGKHYYQCFKGFYTIADILFNNTWVVAFINYHNCDTRHHYERALLFHRTDNYFAVVPTADDARRDLSMHVFENSGTRLSDGDGHWRTRRKKHVRFD
jgi:hypothetical protein